METFIGPQPYNAIKAALITWGKQMSQAVAADGIRVNCVSPGPIYFPGGAWQYIEHNMAPLYQGTLAQIPRCSMGTPQEVANAVVFLASPAARRAAEIGFPGECRSSALAEVSLRATVAAPVARRRWPMASVSACPRPEARARASRGVVSRMTR